MMMSESYDSQMTLDSVSFSPSQSSEIISLSDDNEDDLEIFVSMQPCIYNSISSIQVAQVSQRLEFNWTTVSQSIFMENNRMDQFLQSETSDYDPRYQTETLSDQIESYDHYFNASFDDQLLNINILTVTTDYNRLLDDSFNNEIPKIILESLLQ
uniref:Uncharacterized protein n=1 Tax=Glossina austeni TaxID=7395 RepID=A0A1A9V7W3_GLOAU